ncbi:hypothetical protein [Nitrosomonas nitrosa]|uniref:hypothetical protein n=1 Tax=Nitrosomonas nitrosa TaxID=52442 RepID=UPI0023F7FB5A|nr:hypothetical protein [Nitrosomonas nitrosa]MCO6435000.1 hypothetical protein [Nitrosomonas nitrosa]
MNEALQFSYPIERRVIFTPFGIRFWDPALNNQIRDGLTVTARPLQGIEKNITGVCTASGIYAFHGLPGLHEAEYSLGTSTPDGSLPFSRRFIIMVKDNQLRFLAAVFTVDLPFRGIYPTDYFSSLGNNLPGFYLFSAPTRKSNSTLAVVRAQLKEKTNSSDRKPAANAVLEIIEPNDRVWYGIADEQGSVTVMFPYPTFTGSPGIRLSLPLAEQNQHWSLRIKVRYAPAELIRPNGSQIAELRSILNQTQGNLWSNTTTPLNEILSTLRFGEELILRTNTQSELWVEPS